MRVVAVVPLYPPNSRVGAWLATHSLLRGLVERGHEVEAIPFMANPAAPYYFEGVTVRPGSPIRMGVADADVVLAHAVGVGARDPLAGIRLQAPVVRIVHGLPIDPAPLAGAALIVANSQATARPFTGWSIPVEVVHPATDPAEYRTTPGDRVTLVNLSVAKGGPTFWDVAALAPDIPFLGVQGGYGSQVVRRLPNVEVIGQVAVMRDWVYSRTRLLLMPSVAETWGMVAVEAMCSGIPVLARPTPGLRESLGRAANWCTSDDPAVWAAEIRRLLEPGEWEQASLRARVRAAEIDPLAQRARFAALIESVVAGCLT